MKATYENLEIPEALLSKSQKKQLDAELALIEEIAQEWKNTKVTVSVKHTARLHEGLLKLSDQYELRVLGKKEIKKLPLRYLEALILYGRAYIKDFENGQYMLVKGMADFDEADAFTDIKNVVTAMELEIRSRA